MSELTNVHHAVSAIASVFRAKIDGSGQAWEPQNERTEVVTRADADQIKYPFQATELADGTKVVWVPTPDKFDQFVQAEAIRRAIHRDWGGALGGIMFVNEAKGVAGFIGMHGLGKTRVEFPPTDGNLVKGLLRSLGGIMISSTWSLEHGLEMVVAKMRDMTVKDTRNDRHFKKAGFGEVGWGGGKGMVWHSGRGTPIQEELDVVGEVLKFGGAHVGGNDQGNGKQEGGMISNKAPAQFAGSEQAHEKMRGLFPSPLTAIGVELGIVKVVPKSVPGFLVGFGGVGAPLATELVKTHGYRLAAIMDGNVKALITAKGQGLAGTYIVSKEAVHSLYKPLEVTGVLIEANNQGFVIVENAAEAIRYMRREEKHFGFYSDNGGAHGITEEVAHELVESKIKYVAGAANNQHATPKVIKILQAGSIWYATPHVINGGGAKAVAANLLGIVETAFRRVLEIQAKDVAREYRQFLRGIDNVDMIEREDVTAWNKRVKRGDAVGGYRELTPRAYEANLDVSLMKGSMRGASIGSVAWLLGHPLFTDGFLTEDYYQAVGHTFVGLASFLLAEKALVLAITTGLPKTPAALVAFAAPVLAAGVLGMITDPKSHQAMRKKDYLEATKIFLTHGLIEGVLFSVGNQAGRFAASKGLAHVVSRLPWDLIRRRGVVSFGSSIAGLEGAHQIVSHTNEWVGRVDG